MEHIRVKIEVEKKKWSAENIPSIFLRTIFLKKCLGTKIKFCYIFMNETYLN